MRGEHSHIAGVEQAVAVLDLALGGVKAELAEDVFGWFEAPKPVASKPAAVPPPVVVVDSDRPVVAEAVLPRAEKPVLAPPPPAKAPVIMPEAAGKVWVEGEPGGVVMVVQGGMPEGVVLALAKAMLAAAGLRDVAVGWVGILGGKVEAAEILAALQGLAPQQVLVLGQGPLGMLVGKNLGVEGWHASGSRQVPGWNGGPVGVTYPLDLLVKQPLFKRLAWQHLQAWGSDAMSPDNTQEE